MPESLFKRAKVETVEKESADSSAKDLAFSELVERADVEHLCKLLRAYFVVKEVSKEAAEVLRQEIAKRL